ncbi:MAG TPA: alpha/beta hydrolase fold domain-containing protein [Blastocatellia bacterium]|nr:alpha/beta hydrolase fold domain-containing protein [Blastocatellia bacterium]
MNHTRILLCLTVLIGVLATTRSVNHQAQTVAQPKEVAVTIDDLPLNGPQVDAGRLRAMTDKILSAINKHQIPVVGFVNESLLHVPGETDARIMILKAWSDGGVELGNHTFSHLGFKDASLNEYQDDFLRGEVVTRWLLKQPAPPDFIQKAYLDNQKKAAPAPGSGQAQAPGPNEWVDYASADYDILPNVTYSVANNTELKLDLYLPKNRSVPNPTLMLFHGGGWVDGQKERNVFQLLPYLSLGWAVINVEYRLARNSPAPAAVEDCRCALRWVTYHAKEYGLDASKIVLTGTSAGGHLSLITGMLPAQSIFDRQCPTDSSTRWREGTEPKTNVAAIINWYGITDVAELIDGPNAKHYAMEWFGSMSNREELARQLSPINYIRAGLPPIITIHGDQDDIVPYNHAVRLHAALDKAGAPNQLVTLRGRKHGGFNRQDLVSSYAVIREFLRKHNLLNTEQ